MHLAAARRVRTQRAAMYGYVSVMGRLVTDGHVHTPELWAGVTSPTIRLAGKACIVVTCIGPN